MSEESKPAAQLEGQDVEGELMKLSLEEKLLEMKDTSELMVDLAYSALLFNNKEIASEVYNLEEIIDFLFSRVKRNAVSDAIEHKNADKALALIQLATSIEVIADAAMDIADVVLRDIDPHPVFKLSLRDSDTFITWARLIPESVLANRSLGELCLMSEIGVWVIAVRRGRRWLYGPDGDTLLRPGDILVARCPLEADKEFQELAAGLARDF